MSDDEYPYAVHQEDDKTDAYPVSNDELLENVRNEIYRFEEWTSELYDSVIDAYTSRDEAVALLRTTKEEFKEFMRTTDTFIRLIDERQRLIDLLNKNVHNSHHSR